MAIDSKTRAKLREKLGARYMDLLIERNLDLADIPEELMGKPVHLPQVNFDVPLEQKVRAKMGPPSYAIRAKYLEDTVDALMKELAEKRESLIEKYRGQPGDFARFWTTYIEALDLAEINRLITEHNTFYPIEANLKPDPDTGKIMMGSTVWKPKPRITAESILKKLPPEI